MRPAREMAGQGQQMTQEQLNKALCKACGVDNNHVRATELLGRGADLHALVTGYNALHTAAYFGRIPILNMLLESGAVLEARSFRGTTALVRAATQDKPEVCKFLIEKGADLHAADNENMSALTHYGYTTFIEPEVKAQRVADLVLAFVKHRETEYRTELEISRQQLNAFRQEIGVLECPAHINASLLFSDKFSDVVFVAGGERIRAHRCIVAACSEQLSALLQGQQQAGGVAEIKMDQSAEAVGALLRFMYTGEADEAALSSHWQEVLDLAVQHKQIKLKVACEEIGLKGLSLKIVVPLLIASHLHDLVKLKQACINLVKENVAAVTMSKQFWKLSSEHPELWRETRTALGLPECAGEDDEDEDGAGGQAAKRIKL